MTERPKHDSRPELSQVTGGLDRETNPVWTKGKNQTSLTYDILERNGRYSIMYLLRWRKLTTRKIKRKWQCATGNTMDTVHYNTDMINNKLVFLIIQMTVHSMCVAYLSIIFTIQIIPINRDNVLCII